jgi:hypothetical protein
MEEMGQVHKKKWGLNTIQYEDREKVPIEVGEIPFNRKG